MKEKRDFCEEEEAITKFIVDGGIKRGNILSQSSSCTFRSDFYGLLRTTEERINPADECEHPDKKS